MGNLSKLTLPLAIGILLGIAAVAWIEPSNTGGSVLVIVVCTAIVVVITALIRAVRGKSG